VGNPFITSVKTAVVDLRAAQTKHARLQARADARLAVARDRHQAESAAATRVEAEAWRALLSIPGVTASTVAAILQVHETTVTRWAARASRPSSTGSSPALGTRGGAA
jgi:DNA-binding transcriptional regulator YiaG